MFRIGFALNDFSFAADALGWAIPNFLLARTIHLNQLCIINVGSKCSLNRFEVTFQAIACELNAVG